ncbi:MAG: phenylalanine-4-hydroxylase [Crocinitomicaceae bacterium]|nr:phenylalanine-4-hydroxylase [Crocinitomicaceae bacterium]
MQVALKQEMDKYTSVDFEVWKILFERQAENLKTKGSLHYTQALSDMKEVLNRSLVPDFRALNGFFQEKTGWNIHVVPGLIPVEDFFELLAQKKFCSSTWLRSMENLDYLEEPDMFHDIFGHIPLLSNEVFSAFTHEFGKLGKKHIHNPESLVKLQRLYWFTIEFGVILEEKIKAYGAGIMSSFGETNRIANRECTFHEFDIEAILNKEFRTDVMQEEYFVIESLEQLYNCLPDAEKLLG